MQETTTIIKATDEIHSLASKVKFAQDACNQTALAIFLYELSAALVAVHGTRNARYHPLYLAMLGKLCDMSGNPLTYGDQDFYLAMEELADGRDVDWVFPPHG